METHGQEERVGAASADDFDKANEVRGMNRALSGGMARPTKRWAAMTTDEKLDALRETVQGLAADLGYVGQRSVECEALLKGHEHAQDGRVMKAVVPQYWPEAPRYQPRRVLE